MRMLTPFLVATAFSAVYLIIEYLMWDGPSAPAVHASAIGLLPGESFAPAATHGLSYAEWKGFPPPPPGPRHVATF
jgi:hypothetical protein